MRRETLVRSRTRREGEKGRYCKAKNLSLNEQHREKSRMVMVAIISIIPRGWVSGDNWNRAAQAERM